MLGFVQNWLNPKCNPIGVDFGSDALRLAQVQWTGAADSGEHRLLAAASADVPAHLRADPAARLAFFTETMRDLLAQGNFRGRSAVLALPAAWMHIQHLRVPQELFRGLDEAGIAKALAFEARGKIPIDPSVALLRHLVAGDVYGADQEPKTEVIVLAARRELVNQYLAAAARAKLDVVGLNVEPGAILDCFSFVHRRKSDAESTQCFVDIGCSATRAMIARGGRILFARSIPVGGDHFNRAVAAAMKITADDARLLRIKLCHQQPTPEDRRERQQVQEPQRPQELVRAAEPAIPPADDSPDNSFALLSAGMAASSRASTERAEVRHDIGAEARTQTVPIATAMAVAPAPQPAAPESLQVGAVERACLDPLRKLVEELDLCRRYYEAAFPSNPVERLIFVGGEARQRSLCQHIARGLGLAAQVGDPMVRMARVSDVGVESGLDRRQPQPTWAVAIGLSMGPAGNAASRNESKG